MLFWKSKAQKAAEVAELARSRAEHEASLDKQHAEHLAQLDAEEARRHERLGHRHTTIYLVDGESVYIRGMITKISSKRPWLVYTDGKWDPDVHTGISIPLDRVRYIFMEDVPGATPQTSIKFFPADKT